MTNTSNKKERKEVIVRCANCKEYLIIRGNEVLKQKWLEQGYAKGFKEGEDSLHNKSRKICWKDGYANALADVAIIINQWSCTYALLKNSHAINKLKQEIAKLEKK